MDPGRSSSLRPKETPSAGRSRRLLARIGRALDALVDDGLALDFLVAAILAVLGAWLLEMGTSATFVSVFVLTFVSKHLRGRLEALAHRVAPGEGRARKWGMTSLAAFLVLLDQYAAASLRWVLAKLKLASGQVHGSINAGALPIQVATAAVASVVAVGAVSAGEAVVPDNSTSRASVTAFGTLSFDDWQNAPSDEDVNFLRAAPGSATEPGATIHGCRAAVIAAYVRYSDMTEGTRVTMRSFADNKAWAEKTFSWPNDYPADASLYWTFYKTRNGSAIDEPLTARSWRFELTVSKRRPKETTVTLDNASC